MSSDHRRSRASHSHALTWIIFAAGTFGLDMDQSLAQTCSYKHSFSNERLLDDQEIETARVDNSPSSHAKDTGKKENKRGKHRPDIKAD